MDSIQINTDLSPNVFRNKTDITVDSVNAENHLIFWFDRYEYPEEGGILAYKYGGIAVKGEGEPHARHCKIDELNAVAKEEKEKGFFPKTNKIPQCGYCGMCLIEFIPKVEIQNRVDLLYPEKGFIHPIVIEKINPAKTFLINQIQFLTGRHFIIQALTLLFTSLRFKVEILEKWIDSYNDSVSALLHNVYLEDKKLYSNVCRELLKFIESFLVNLGVNAEKAALFAENLIVLIEFDSAYRYRIEDIFSMTTKERMLKNPRREIKRMLWYLQDRDERTDLNNKFKAIGLGISLILYHPKVLKAFKDAMSRSKFENFQLDTADKYHVLRLGSYKFMGRDLEDRVNEYKQLHNGNWPEPFSVTIQ